MVAQKLLPLDILPPRHLSGEQILGNRGGSPSGEAVVMSSAYLI